MYATDDMILKAIIEYRRGLTCKEIEAATGIRNIDAHIYRLRKLGAKIPHKAAPRPIIIRDYSSLIKKINKLK